LDEFGGHSIVGQFGSSEWLDLYIQVVPRCSGTSIQGKRLGATEGNYFGCGCVLPQLRLLPVVTAVDEGAVL
jgi:hypothetical protein